MPYIKSADWKHLQEKFKRLESVVDAAASETESSKQDLSTLKKDVKDDILKVHTRDMNQVIINACIQHNIRYEANVPETGKRHRVQPFELTDSVYNVISKPMLERVLKETDVDRAEYKPDDHDCEDFARELVSACHKLGLNSVGRVLSQTARHAFNIAVVHANKRTIEVVFIEPQNDQIVTPNSKGYELKDALLIIS